MSIGLMRFCHFCSEQRVPNSGLAGMQWLPGRRLPVSRTFASIPASTGEGQIPGRGFGAAFAAAQRGCGCDCTLGNCVCKSATYTGNYPTVPRQRRGHRAATSPRCCSSVQEGSIQADRGDEKATFIPVSLFVWGFFLRDKGTNTQGKNSLCPQLQQEAAAGTPVGSPIPVLSSPHLNRGVETTP